MSTLLSQPQITLDQVTPVTPSSTGRSRLFDILVFVGAAALVYSTARLGSSVGVHFSPTAQMNISTNISKLPYYAGRSLLRMFIALFLAVVFTLIYGTLAARSKRLGKVLIPILDVLQSVPILAFLSVTITMFIALFPGSQWGLECASIFAIFTGQAWNMTFAFYYSLRSQPRELDEMARLLKLSRWQRFWRLDVPSSMMPLVWNGMMSFAGGWFFLVASEAVSVNNRNYALPGVGSYVAAANEHAQLGRIIIAIAVMAVMVVGVNILFWAPLTAWAERFRLGDCATPSAPRSIVFTILSRSHVCRWVGAITASLTAFVDRLMVVTGTNGPRLHPPHRRNQIVGASYWLIVVVACVWTMFRLCDYVRATTGLGQLWIAFEDGLVTFARVAALLVVASVIWVPIGVVIGLNPRLTNIAQPVVQILASFPANLAFPLVTAGLLATHISLNFGGIVLMALGSQWYILFNVIAGASAVPNDLREVSRDLSLSTRTRWSKLILPAVFPSFVTGGITAAGGAWNASIVAEVVSYGHTTLTATGLGAYIANATSSGNQGQLVVGVIVMSAFVVGTNAILWRPLYNYAARRFSF